MTLPYKWHPDGADLKFALEEGDLLAWEHAVYRVILVENRPGDHDENYPLRVIYRPIEIDPDDLHAKDHNKALKGPARYPWRVYPDEHYPICAKCHEPLPCREQMVDRTTAEGRAEFDRHSIASVCPACSKPVTARQKSITWQENVVVPFGPPVTFHLRGDCWWAARRYERAWHLEDPSRRRVLSCDGYITVHCNGTYDCTVPGCPGPGAQHPSRSNHYPGHTDCLCVGGAA